MMTLENYSLEDCKLQAGEHLFAQHGDHVCSAKCLYTVGTQKIIAE